MDLLRTPRVSVIVPVRDRREPLVRLLGAIAAQTFTDFELIVIDDGSSDGSGDEARAAASSGLPVRVERTDGVGAVEARRIGVAAARGEHLAFTDSDCIPEPRWLAEGVAALDAGADVVAGVTVAQRQQLVFERAVRAPTDDGMYATCNVFYRRSAYEDAGGFTDAGRLLGFRRSRWAKGLGFGEDTLLAWRVRRAGRFAFVPSAVVEHAVVQPRVLETLRREWAVGAFPRLVREVPELRRRLLRWRIWLGYRRIPLYATAVAAALPWRLWLVGPAGAVWLMLRTRDVLRLPGSWRRKIAGIPFEMTVDVVTAVALVTGSLRARSLVL